MFEKNILRKTKGIKRSNALNHIVFLGPMLLCFIPIVIFPFFYSIYMSFIRWNGISSVKTFIGLENYKTVFSDDPDYWRSILFSIRSTIYITILSNLLGLLLALLVTTIHGKLKDIYRTLLLFPNIMGGIIMGFIWRFIFQKCIPSLGKIPFLFFLDRSWLSDPTNAFWAIVIVSVWQYSGYTMIIYIAGLTGISSDIKDAVKIDGCSKLREFFSVTLPLIMPSVTICIFYVMVKTFTMYDLTSSLTEGGPYKSTMTASMDLYAEAFTKNKYGLGSAKAIIFFFFILIISILQVSFTRSKEVEQ